TAASSTAPATRPRRRNARAHAAGSSQRGEPIIEGPEVRRHPAGASSCLITYRKCHCRATAVYGLHAASGRAAGLVRDERPTRVTGRRQSLSPAGIAGSGETLVEARLHHLDP